MKDIIFIDGLNVLNDKAKAWYFKGSLHRIGGPAYEHQNGTKWWYQYGLLHREDGPALERYDDLREWYIRGKLIGRSEDGMTQEKFLRLIRLKAFLVGVL